MALTLTVTVDRHPDAAEVVETQVRNPDRVRWDMAAQRNGWPTFEKVPFLGTTYLAWAALKREGKYNGTWDDFKDRECLDGDSRDASPNEDEDEGK